MQCAELQMRLRGNMRIYYKCTSCSMRVYNSDYTATCGKWEATYTTLCGIIFKRTRANIHFGSKINYTEYYKTSGFACVVICRHKVNKHTMIFTSSDGRYAVLYVFLYKRVCGSVCVERKRISYTNCLMPILITRVCALFKCGTPNDMP